MEGFFLLSKKPPQEHWQLNLWHIWSTNQKFLLHCLLFKNSLLFLRSDWLLLNRKNNERLQDLNVQNKQKLSFPDPEVFFNKKYEFKEDSKERLEVSVFLLERALFPQDEWKLQVNANQNHLNVRMFGVTKSKTVVLVTGGQKGIKRTNTWSGKTWIG